MIQLALFTEHRTDQERALREPPACTCDCGDFCHGECGCEYCSWCFDDEVFQPVYFCCSVCGNVLAVEYGDGIQVRSIGKLKCCERDYKRIFYGE